MTSQKNICLKPTFALFLVTALALPLAAKAQAEGAASVTVRTPEQYLKDFKELLDSDDISQSQAVGQALHMTVAPKVGEAVDSSSARGNAPIAGVSHDFRRTANAGEYLDYPFQYGDFIAAKGGTTRVVLEVYLDKSRICIAKGDLDTVLGPMRAVPLSEGAGVSYFKDVHGANDVSAAFTIASDTQCVERIALTQNTQRE